MSTDWEKQAALQSLSERIRAGEFAANFEALQAELDALDDLLDARDRQQVLQYWFAVEKRDQGSAG